jgi:hypothetical protein
VGKGSLTAAGPVQLFLRQQAIAILRKGESPDEAERTEVRVPIPEVVQLLTSRDIPHVDSALGAIATLTATDEHGPLVPHAGHESLAVGAEGQASLAPYRGPPESVTHCADYSRGV